MITLGVISQYYKGIGDVYEFTNWVIRLDKDIAVLSDKMPKNFTEFNSCHSLWKAFDYRSNKFLMWYHSETVVTE